MIRMPDELVRKYRAVLADARIAAEERREYLDPVQKGFGPVLVGASSPPTGGSTHPVCRWRLCCVFSANVYESVSRFVPGARDAGPLSGRGGSWGRAICGVLAVPGPAVPQALGTPKLRKGGSTCKGGDDDDLHACGAGIESAGGESAGPVGDYE